MSEKLIYVMSTREHMKISDFYDLIRAENIPYSSKRGESRSVNKKQEVIQVMDSLGYCEFDFNKNMVYMCQPSIVLLPSFGLPKAVLVGARTPDFMKRLKDSVKKRGKYARFFYYEQAHTNVHILPTFYIESTCKEILNEIAQEIGIPCYLEMPASWALANFSASISEMIQNLNFGTRSEPNWMRWIFNTNRLEFLMTRQEITDEYYLAAYRSPITQQLEHFIWHSDTAAILADRNWGKYIMLYKKNINILLYDELQCTLAVPLFVHLPCILARAAALSSGTPPIIRTFINNHRDIAIPNEQEIQIYPGVYPNLASIIASKLGQKLIQSCFEIKEDGKLYV